MKRFMFTTNIFKVTPVTLIPTQFFKSAIALMAMIVISTFVSADAIGQSDAVYKFKKSGGTTKVSGTIKEITPLAVTIQTSNGPETIPAAAIKKVTVKDEPSEVDRARDRFQTGRFDDGLEELNKVKAAGSPITQAEIDYLKAYGAAKIALGGGQITAQKAGSAMSNFLGKHGTKSHHFAPATEMMGHLAVAAGEKNLDFGKKEYAKLTKSQWPEYVMKGYFYQGETLIKQGNYAEAIANYGKILEVGANDDLAQQYKLLAKCQQAKAQGLAGEAGPAIEVIESIIRDENPDNAQLFAYAYNARGAIQLKSNMLKEARESFLFTDLLFSTETEPHAEAVFNLAKIWQQLEKTDRSNESRETLKRRYRNSFWSTKL